MGRTPPRADASLGHAGRMRRGEAVELGDDQHGPGEAAGIESLGKLRPVVVLARLNLGERLGQRSGTAVEEGPCV
jgi:hypothetical protein